MNLGGGQARVVFHGTAGLKTVVMVKADRCSAVATAYSTNDVLLGTSGTLEWGDTYTPPVGTIYVRVLATRNSGETVAYVTALAKDDCNNVSNTDPMITTLEVLSGGSVVQRVEGIHAAERYLQVINGTPGLRQLEAQLNGRRFRVEPLAAGASLWADLGAAMHEGEANTLLLTGWGEPGVSALVMLSDAPDGSLVALPEAGPLRLSRAADGLTLAWPAALAEWRLQASETLAGGWADVTATPLAHDGELQVTVPLAGGAQFYRLRADTFARPAASLGGNPSPALGVTMPKTSTTTPKQTTYDGYPF